MTWALVLGVGLVALEWAAVAIVRVQARRIERDRHRRAMRAWGISDVLVVRRPDPNLPPPTYLMKQPEGRQ